MNRKQRRAALKQHPAPGARDPGASAQQAFADAEQLHAQGRLDDAARAYRRLLSLQPADARASNNLGLVLLAQGKRSEASAAFAQALTLMPQLLEQYNGVCNTLAAVLPPIGDAMRRALAAFPQRPAAAQLFAPSDLAAVYADPLLLCLLDSVPVRHSGLDLVLTALRAAWLDDANAREDALGFGCALARQCFTNEYVFATTAEEEAQVEQLAQTIAAALSAGVVVSPSQVAALAMYRPLSALPFADALLAGAWPPPLDAVLTQQIREPREEAALRTTISRLTAIDDAVSQRVQQQYEENPYPRGVRLAGGVTPVTLDQHLRNKFPTAAFAPWQHSAPLDILVPGCGTSLGAEVAQMYGGARVLAVDLSLASLAYARRSTPPALAARVDYAQGDILRLGAIGRDFDLIDCTGVLHHMADPLEGWRGLLSLLRPNGIMHLGFYSERGRGDIIAARRFIAEHGYTASAADIRRCRQHLLQTEHRSVARFHDFFATSECRDLLFHVQESRMTLPAIRDFIAAHGLKFIGFDLDDNAARHFRGLFAANGWAMNDLDQWDAIEGQNPATFSGMFQFWVQKAA